jgi:hypothetical protein
VPVAHTGPEWLGLRQLSLNPLCHINLRDCTIGNGVWRPASTPREAGVIPDGLSIDVWNCLCKLGSGTRMTRPCSLASIPTTKPSMSSSIEVTNIASVWGQNHFRSGHQGCKKEAKGYRLRQGLKLLAAFKFSHDNHNMSEDRTTRLPLLATTTPPAIHRK